jgi:uncharacterized membrane protein
MTIKVVPLESPCLGDHFGILCAIRDLIVLRKRGKRGEQKNNKRNKNKKKQQQKTTTKNNKKQQKTTKNNKKQRPRHRITVGVGKISRMA